MAYSDALKLTLPQTVYFMVRSSNQKRELTRAEAHALGEANAKEYERQRIERINAARASVGLPPHSQ